MGVCVGACDVRGGPFGLALLQYSSTAASSGKINLFENTINITVNSLPPNVSDLSLTRGKLLKIRLRIFVGAGDRIPG